MTILSVPGRPPQSARACLAALLAASLAACSVVKDQLRAEGPRWPQPRDKHLRMDGPDLRVHAETQESAKAAEDEAESALTAYLRRLAVLGDAAEREARIAAALKRAAPQNGRGANDLYTSDIDVPLSDLQELLGTSYE